ncbi:MAG: ATP synthase F0 subunit B [Acidobacteria bacterium]|nr:ATP synthase F0 subunit B [Acidobacteriota bacterium]MCW5967524.1 ATP synthase F0 subunit B [Blastocatellales bacterium]
MGSPALALPAFAGDSILSVDGSFLVVFISIFCLVFILNRTLFKPINAVLEERERLGAGRAAEAQRMLRDAEDRLKNYEEKVRAARAESYSRFEAQRRDLLAARQQMLAEVRSEVSEKVSAARAEIAGQASAARTSLEGEARLMASSIASRILQRPVLTEGNRN